MKNWIERFAVKPKSEKDLKIFCFGLGGILGIGGTYVCTKGHPGWEMIFFPAGIFVLLGAFKPIIISPIYRLWMSVARVLGELITGTILFIVFFVILTPIAWIARLSRKRFLDLDWRPGASTHWKKIKENGTDPRAQY